jgi:sodium pump decarboxylase gamma subunit
MPADPSFADRLWFGASVMLVGMAIVFSVLILLWVILELFGLVGKIFGKKASAEPQITPEAPAPENADDEKETVAAITAALSVVLEKPVSGFRVVSFKKRSNWKSP